MRLIDQLEASNYGKLRHIKKGREAFYQLDRPKHLPKISLNAEGLYQLALCRDFLLHLLPDAMRKSMDATLLQAATFLSEDEVGDLSDSFGQSIAKGRIDYTPFQDMLQSLMQGIREHKVCTVRCKSALHKEVRDFEYAPMRLIAYHEAIHVIGWTVTEKGAVQARFESPTTLALQRLQKVSITQRYSGCLPAPNEGGGTFGLIKSTSFTAIIRFNESAAAYVAEREWSVGQKIVVHKNGDLTLTLTASNSAEFTSWILSFGDDAEILSPKWLREEPRAMRKKIWLSEVGCIHYFEPGEKNKKMPCHLMELGI
jgi:predicted DNA-binding transcriptional regulator YafY